MHRLSPWWQPHVYADRRPFLLRRTRMVAAARAFFVDASFLEVDPAILQVSPGNEAHIGAFATELVDPAGERSRLYLHASPEFACKKLLAAGEPRIFTFAHVFRNGERGPLHHPEFTMLEWYRAGASYLELAADCAALLAATARAAQTDVLRFRGRTADPFAAPEFLSVTEAFTRFARIDLVATLNDRAALADAAAQTGLRVVADDTWSDLFSKLLSAHVEPHLGHGRATVLYDYPAAEAALAQLNQADPRYAARFELYVCGVEVANAFDELVDAAEQRRRFVAEMAERQRIYGEAYPLDEDFLAALEVMPAACGIALGFDRLVMLATGAERIEQVLWGPVAEQGVA